jgi:hypothetical protein
VNGDGLDDVVVGAYMFDVSGALRDAGAVHVLPGVTRRRR